MTASHFNGSFAARPRSRVSVCLVVVSVLLVSMAADAADPRFYSGSHGLLGSTRLVGLAGAYTGIAEGAEAPQTNLAAFAQRRAKLDRAWDWDFAFTYSLSPILDSARRDMDNDGQADRAAEFFDLLFVGMLQYRRLGFGVYLRGGTWSFPVGDPAGAPAATEDDRLSVSDGTMGFLLSYALPDEEWLFGTSFFGAGPHFSFRQDEAEYRLYGFQVDVLWRPDGAPFRIGVSLVPITWGGGRMSTAWAGELEPFLHYRTAALPASLSLGTSWRFGPGAERYNLRSVIARRERGDLPAEGELPVDASAGWILITAQVDLFAPVADAIALQPCRVAECHPATAPRVGAWPGIVPRIGAEVEPLERRLRLRLGSYLERSIFPGVGPRPHLTGGFELRLLGDWAVSASIDHARLFQDVSVSIGFWN